MATYDSPLFPNILFYLVMLPCCYRMSLGPQGKGGGATRARGTALYRYLFLLATAGGAAAFLLLSMHSGSELLFLARRPAPPAWDRRPHVFDVGNPFTIDTDGCTIPGLKPFDDSVKKFIVPPHVSPCHNANFTLLQNNDTHIWISKAERASFLLSNITCCYKSFYRPLSVDDITSKKVDNRVEYRPCVYFTEYIEVLNEFVKVTCVLEPETYEQFFLFAPKKPLMKRLLIEEVNSPIKPEYNVIIMGLDGISRLNFYRTMPKTLAYLKDKGAIELMGYNKVGDNTFPNLIPVLLGVRDVELHKLCWPHTKATFDNCPFVWELFKDVGYYTALAEDSAKLGTFNYNRPGFVAAPTDYYARPFMHEAEVHTGNNFLKLNSFLCMGNKYFYQVLLDYIKSLTSTLRKNKLFGFFWEVSMSHDYLNHPLFMDNSYEMFLNDLDDSRYLDDTILIFMSDHGIRWGGIRYTKQGRLEARLPLMFILLPLSFRKKYNMAYDNMRINSRRLTTPFDIYATLSDLVDMSSLTNESIMRRSATAYGQNRGISLFLPIPRNRTCKMADIDDHWCTCHKGQKTALDTGEAREAAAHLVRQLNARMRAHPECARLKLAELLEVTELVAGGAAPGAPEQDWREYTVVVRTEPGGGVFEATLRRAAADWALAGTVSRLNLYGDQSRCVHHFRLKLYCYCQ